MAVRRHNPRLSKNAKIPSAKSITFLLLGRGGVQEDGTLDRYGQERVDETLLLARNTAKQQPNALIQILFTGGHNRAQDRSGATPPSEGGAAARYAATQRQRGDAFMMLTEENSTSTVENATAVEDIGLIPDNDTIVIVSDQLHFLLGKVQFIAWMVFPRRRTIFVELVGTPPGTTVKAVVMHVISTAITIVGMIGVKRGDAAAIQRRQELLQRLLRH